LGHDRSPQSSETCTNFFLYSFTLVLLVWPPFLCSGTVDGMPCAVVTDPTSRCPSHRKLFLHLIAGKESPPAARGPRKGASAGGKAGTGIPTASATATTTATATPTGSGSSSELGSDNGSSPASRSASGEGATPADSVHVGAAPAPQLQLQGEAMYRVSWREDGAFRKSYIECILLGAKR